LTFEFGIETKKHTVFCTQRMAKLLLFALQDLKSALISQGSDLVLRLGSLERVLSKLVKPANVRTNSMIEILFSISDDLT
jgi:deoxyribodipyrimidine photolyase